MGNVKSECRVSLSEMKRHFDDATYVLATTTRAFERTCRNWPFGATYCVINNFVAYVTVTASVLTLTAITLER